MEIVITVILLIAGLYLLLGLLFAFVFLFKGITRVDESAVGTSWKFRLLILPGTICFWPVLLHKWMKNS